MISRLGTPLLILAAAALFAGSPAFAQGTDDGMTLRDRTIQARLQDPDLAGVNYIDQSDGTLILSAYSNEEIDELYMGRTNRYKARGEGVQIEYTAPDGRLYLWYPENERVAVGQWRIDGQTHVCFRYPVGVHLPSIAHADGSWACHFISLHSTEITDSRAGDFFSLSARNGVPFVMPRRSGASINGLQRRIVNATAREVEARAAEIPDAPPATEPEEEVEEEDEPHDDRSYYRNNDYDYD